jgi:hypothetical protein
VILKQLSGLVATLFFGVSFAYASPTKIAWGGNPKPLEAGTTVRLETEKVKLKVGPIWTSVICAYELKNLGPACKVRVGFPDLRLDENKDPHPGGGDEDAHVSDLRSFQAFIDGNKCKSLLVGEEDVTGGDKMREIKVSFGRRQSHILVDQYKVRTGMALTNDKIGIHEVGYAMHTGAGWKDSIKKVTVLVQFEDSLIPAPIHAISSRLLATKQPTEYEDWGQVKFNTVYYHGFSKPAVDGMNALFVARNLKPTKRSDVYLFFRSRERARKSRTHKRIRHRQIVGAEDSEQ